MPARRVRFLLDFLFEGAKFLGVKELNQRDVQPVAELFDRDDPRVPAAAVQNVLHRRRRHGR